MIGKMIGGKYNITEKLGTGGSGRVYKAYHTQLKTPWALKIVSFENSMHNELEVLKKLNHPAFPRLVDVIEENGESILVFDFYEGLNLQKVLEQYGAIDEERVCYIASQILDALAYLHTFSPEPIIYRDLKPSNLILLPNDVVKLIDFGTARLFKQNHHDDTVYLGTPGYAAPEQYGIGQTDIRTDFYNLGMTLFHLVTGRHPLQCDDASAGQILNEAGVSTNLSAIILKCISKDPADRYSYIEQIKQDFNGLTNQNVFIAPKAAGKNAVEISISGIQSGLGVTHFCMLFGIWLKKQGFRTAVVELCENHDGMALCRLVEKQNHVSKNGFFQIHGLSIFPAMCEEQFDGFRRADYDYVLLDYGVHDEFNSRMMRRSDIRLIMAPGADWKLGQLGKFMEKHNSILMEKNTYLGFPLQNHKSMQIIQSWFRLSNMITIPYAVNPWKVDNTTNSELQCLYQKFFQTELNKNHTGKRRSM